MVRWAERQRNVQTRFWTLQRRVVLRVLEVVGAWGSAHNSFHGYAQHAHSEYTTRQVYQHRCEPQRRASALELKSSLRARQGP